MPPADAELKLVFGSAGASPSLFNHALSAGSLGLIYLGRAPDNRAIFSLDFN